MSKSGNFNMVCTVRYGVTPRFVKPTDSGSRFLQQ